MLLTARAKVFFVAVVALTLTQAGMSQSENGGDIATLNKQMVAAIQLRRFEEALLHAEALIVSIGARYGEQGDQLAMAYSNHGSLLRQLERFADAVVSLEKALAIREKIPGGKVADRIALMDSIAFCKAKSKDYKSADLIYKAAIDLLAKAGMNPGPETYALFLGAANNAANLKNFKRANELYLICLRLAYKHFEVDSPEREDLLLSRVCLSPSEKFDEPYKSEEKHLRKAEEETKGVVNGMAKHIPAPFYGPVARASRLFGTVYFRISIDATGRVVDATPICDSNPILASGAVGAARKAIYSPTYKNGRAIPIVGVLRFTFEL